jgi:hypothetical protein
MKSFASCRKYLSASALVAALLVTDFMFDGALIPAGAIVSSAEARIGHPATPRSVAGVARRTTRRVIRRSTVYVAALPASCSTVVINAVRLSRCGGVYYQRYRGRYVVVYVD